jgi:D-arabinose 5-phosphate isomerase GutQ
MAYTPASLTRLAGASGVSLWHYSTEDTVATVNTSGYFNDATAMLRLNDVILCISSTGGTPVVSQLYVNSNSSGVVDVTDGVVVTATDTD